MQGGTPSQNDLRQAIQAMLANERDRLAAAEQRQVSAEEQQVSLAMSVRRNRHLDATIRDTAAQAAKAGQARIAQVRQVAARRAQALDQASRDIDGLLRAFGGDP